MDTYTLLIIVHLLGVVLAVGGATMVEVALTKSLSDGTMSPDERGILTPSYSVVRIGFVITILSGFGFLIYYKMTNNVDELYNPVLWAKMVIILVIALNALLLQARKISLYWGSALSFVSWWLATLLGIFLSVEVGYSFVGIMLTYAVALVIGAALLHHVRMRITNQSV